MQNTYLNSQNWQGPKGEERQVALKVVGKFEVGFSVFLAVDIFSDIDLKKIDDPTTR